uniref:FAD:protein FMN transferase n=2 Tax=Comamonas sp. MYb396 TaxID=2745302 RepID=UPI0030DAE66E
MSTAPRIHYGAGIWQIPQAQAGGEGQAAPASPAPAGRSFASPAWRAPAMQHAQDGSLHSLQGATMGTTWSLRLVNPDYAPLAPVQALVQQTLDAVIAQMSNWEADSCLSRFNAADAGSWHVLPPELAQVLDAALYWARACDGAYDPTIGALVSLWGFGPRADPQAPHSGQPPAQAAIDRALQACGHQRLQWQPQLRRLLQPGGLQLDLSGIAKGYAVDWVAERLRAAGWQHALLEIGGEIRAWGQKPGGQPWRVAVAGVAGDEPLVVPLGDGALASSGDHWHVFMQGGQRFSHSLDPRTGRPVAHALTSVTVYHDECMHADALATVLTVLGPEAGWRFALQQQLAAVFHSHPDAGQPQGLRRMTPAWQQRFAGSMQ